MITGIYNERKDMDKITYIKLKNNNDGSYGMILVDEKGNEIAGGNLLTIKSDGSFIRNKYIYKHLKLNINEMGQLNEVII